jgi:hypothetical protein
MPKSTKSKTSRERSRTRKNFRLHQAKLDAAREVLGTETETETIERALDLVAFGDRLAKGTARARGRTWNDLFGEMEEVLPSPPSQISRT